MNSPLVSSILPFRHLTKWLKLLSVFGFLKTFCRNWRRALCNVCRWEDWRQLLTILNLFGIRLKIKITLHRLIFSSGIHKCPNFNCTVSGSSESDWRVELKFITSVYSFRNALDSGYEIFPFCVLVSPYARWRACWNLWCLWEVQCIQIFKLKLVAFKFWISVRPHLWRSNCKVGVLWTKGEMTFGWWYYYHYGLPSCAVIWTVRSHSEFRRFPKMDRLFTTWL